jgi:hypothetical protein
MTKNDLCPDYRLRSHTHRKKNKPTTKRAIKRHWGTTSSDETDDEACQLKTRINKSERKKKEDDEDKYTASKKSKKPKKVKEEDYSDDTV